MTTHHCTAAAKRPSGFNGWGSKQTLWGLRHTNSRGTERDEGEGALFSPPGHRSSKFWRTFSLPVYLLQLNTNNNNQPLGVSASQLCVVVKKLWCRSRGEKRTQQREKQEQRWDFGSQSLLFGSLLLLGKWEDPKRRRKRENCLRAQSSKNGLSM